MSIGRKLAEHGGRDESSHMKKHSNEKDHPVVKFLDFEIFSKEFRKRIFKRNISEAFFFKENNPSLNRQEKSVTMTLFS